MAKNDMEVIMYKILRYLYECMKLGVEPELEQFAWNSKLFDIPQSYWNKPANVESRVIQPIREELTPLFRGLTIRKKYGKGR